MGAGWRGRGGEELGDAVDGTGTDRHMTVLQYVLVCLCAIESHNLKAHLNTMSLQDLYIVTVDTPNSDRSSLLTHLTVTCPHC